MGANKKKKIGGGTSLLTLQVRNVKTGDNSYWPTLVKYVNTTEQETFDEDIISIPTTKGTFRNYEAFEPIIDKLVSAELTEDNFGGESVKLTFSDGIERYNLEFPVYKQSGSMTSLMKSFCQRMLSIDLNEDVRINPYTHSKDGSDFTETRFSIKQKQDGELQAVKYSFTMDEIPEWEQKKKGKKVTYDTTDQDNFFYEKFQEFSKLVKENTPLEAAVAEEDDDLPF